MSKEKSDPFKDMWNMNTVSRIFFWATVEKQCGNKKPFIVLLFNELVRIVVTLIIFFGGLFVAGFIIGRILDVILPGATPI